MSKRQNEQPITSARVIMEKLDKILQTTYETLNLLKSFERKGETRNGRPESII